MSREYENGFLAGIDFAKTYWDPNTGGYNTTFPENFIHRGSIWSCGFGEGLITGRSEVIDAFFKNYEPYTGLSWNDGQVTIHTER